MGSALSMAVMEQNGMPLPRYFPGNPFGLWSQFVHAAFIATVPLLAFLGGQCKALEAQRSSRKLLDSVINSMTDAVVLKDRELRIVMCNSTYAGLLGKRPADLCGKTDIENGWDPRIVTGNDAAGQPGSEATDRAALSGQMVHLAANQAIVNGEVRVADSIKVPLRDGRENIVGVLGVHRDVTARLLTEQQLRASDQRFFSVIAAMAEGVLVYGADGIIEFSNENAQRILVRSAEQLIGQPAISPDWEAIHEDGSPFPGSSHPATLALGNGCDQTGVCMGIRKPGGTTTWTWMNARPLFQNEESRPYAVVATFADITDHRALQEQFLQAQKMESVGRLAGGVAHDFNNLLTVISGYSQMLLTKLRADDPMRNNVAEIHKTGERAAGLTRQLLDLSRKQIFEPRVLDLNRLLEEMRPMLERLVGEDVEFCSALHAESGTIHADPHRLEQVVMNLVVNARDAMPRGGNLTIETGSVERDESYCRLHPQARVGRYVMLAVTDNGVGMEEETRRHLFEPFFTTKGAGKGTGLGLAMVQGIVKQSGGYIDVYSEPGQGTTFKIYLPASVEASADEWRPATVPVPEGTETVLVVEDQAEVRCYVVAVLNGCGYRVIEAEDANQALSVSEREPDQIHLILTDVVMPNVSGRELASRLEKLRPGIKVLFMSGYTDDATIMHHGVPHEGAALIQKPFSPEELAEKVRAVLGPTSSLV